jgi:ATP-binding cassette, subfamily F, member 3
VLNGRARQYDGDLSDYRNLILTTDRPQDKPLGPPKTKAERKEAQAQRQALAPLRKRVAELDKVIAAEVLAISRIDETLADGSIYQSDPRRANDLVAQRATHQAKLAKAEEDWLEASHELEQQGKLAET